MTQGQRHALLKAINERFNDYGSRVRLYEKGMCWDGDKIQFVVNWAATGDNTPEEALEMAEELKVAAKVCDGLNKEGFIFQWKEGEDQELTLDDRRAMLEEYRHLIAILEG